MRFAITIGLILSVTFSAGQGRASSSSCDLIETLVNLPVDLASLRANGGSATAFQMELRRTFGQLSDRRQTSVFSRQELRAMRIFAGAIREDWKLNGRSPNGRQIPGLTKTSATIQTQLIEVVGKFGCDVPGAGSPSSLWQIGDPPISPLVLLLGVSSTVLLVLGVYRVIRKRYQSTRRICNLPARLFEGENCFATTVLDISRGGAMVENPVEDFSAPSLTLHLAGHEIGARVAWANGNFIGLNFEKMLPARVVDEIVDMAPSTDLPEEHADAAPNHPETGQQGPDPKPQAAPRMKEVPGT